jgi:hypothetical protein
MSHPVGERLGLAGARAGGDQQRRRRSGTVADAIFDSVALFRIEAVQMLRAIDRLQLCVPFPFALGDSIGATASQCSWPGRRKRGVRRYPDCTLDQFLPGRGANRPSGDLTRRDLRGSSSAGQAMNSASVLGNAIKRAIKRG